MKKGTVKFYNTAKGFGFITEEDGNDLFFHVSDVLGVEPADGEKVGYVVGEGKKGPCANDIRVLVD